MSTIAIEIGDTYVTMSGDRQTSQANWGCSSMTKVWKRGDQLIGLVGEMGRGMQVVEWYKKGGNLSMFPTEAMKGGDFILLIWNGVNIITIDEQGFPLMVEDTSASVGSGAMAAMGAMRMGAGAQMAIEVASELDSYTGRGTDTIRVAL